MKLCNTRLLILILLSGMAVTYTYAQDKNNIDLDQATSEEAKGYKVVILKKRTREEEEKGIQYGDFILYPSISLTEYYDSNIYATENNTLDDFVTVMIPVVNIESNWKEDSLNISAGGQISRYADYSTENTNDYWFDASGRIDIDPGKNLFAAAGYAQEHIDRGSPDAQFGVEPTRYDVTSANAGYVGWSGNHQFKIAYTFNRYDYLDNVSITGDVISNDDQDRDDNGVGFRYMYHYSNMLYPYIQVLADTRDYDIEPDYAGYYRDSDGIRADIGMHIRGESSSGKFYVGVLERDYSDDRFDNISEPDYGLYYNWRVTSDTNLIFSLSRAIEETILPGTPGYLATDSTVQLRQKFGDRNLVRLVYARADVDYLQIVRDDMYQSYVLGYSRKIVDELILNIDLEHGTRDSNIAGDDYTIDQIFFRIKAVI